MDALELSGNRRRIVGTLKTTFRAAQQLAFFTGKRHYARLPKGLTYSAKGSLTLSFDPLTSHTNFILEPAVSAGSPHIGAKPDRLLGNP